MQALLDTNIFLEILLAQENAESAKALLSQSARHQFMNQSAIFAEKFDLDFDDAYQYTTARQYKLTLVRFDSDFRRTDSGCKTPAEILREI